LVNFHTREDVDRHLRLSLFCGIQAQKVVILEDIKIHPAMYLRTRMRCEKPPKMYGGLVSPEALQYEVSEESGFTLMYSDEVCISPSGDSFKSLIEDLL
jgi:hypothetical protein